MATTLRLEECGDCGTNGYDHRHIRLVVDGHLHAEATLCRRCATGRIIALEHTVEHGNPTPFES